MNCNVSDANLGSQCAKNTLWLHIPLKACTNVMDCLSIGNGHEISEKVSKVLQFVTPY